ncbi:MAG: PilT/PilU family type 4a pilus ATPase [Planctomycetes bacterium]|nr:PilT/PilU family type 4a pilus ATPase [Planctomycetota bacterium]
MRIEEVLGAARQRGATDVLLVAGAAPALRVDKELVALEGAPLAPEDTRRLADRMLDGEQALRLSEQKDVDLAFHLEGLGRYRANVHVERGLIGISLRVIPDRVPSLEELGLPEQVASLARTPRGLVLVTGVTGSGKSTTLAAMVDLINRERAWHIVTLEDPIEYVHANRRGLVEQREVGRDTPSFPEALRHVVRQDPDAILLGEMRDLETIACALTAAETGHLVLASLHTIDAARAVERIGDAFPPQSQAQVRTQLANTLVGVVGQSLLPRRDHTGLVAAVEVMVCTPAVRKCIRENELHQIPGLIQTGRAAGMVLLDDALRELYLKRLVYRRDVVERAANPEAMERSLPGMGERRPSTRVLAGAAGEA